MSTDSTNLHNDAFVADLHCDTVLYIKGGRDIGVRNPDGHIDLPRLKAGGVNAQVFACFVPPDTPTDKCADWTNDLIDHLDRAVEANADRMTKCVTAAQIRRAKSMGQLATVYAIENGQAIESNLDNLEHFYARGVRYMTLTHSRSHDWCSSCTDPNKQFDGLTDFGREVVGRMDEIGMLVDVSHISPGAVDDVLETSRRPILASHSNALALCSHPRNLGDRHLRAIADKGGLVAVNFAGHFLRDEWHQRFARFMQGSSEVFRQIDEYMSGRHNKQVYEERRAALQPVIDHLEAQFRQDELLVEHVIDQIVYMVRLVGDDFVGLGSDYDGILWPPTGLEDCSGMPNITAALLERGMPERSIRKVLGENFLRVFEDVCG